MNAEYTEHIYQEYHCKDYDPIHQREEIVRCKDCKHFVTDKFGDCCTLFDFEDVKSMKEKYCAWGDRESATNNLAAELMPCPFCGGEAHSVNAYSLYFVKCTNCQAESKFYSTEAEAAEAWNARAERTCSVEETCFDELWQEKYTRLSCGHYVWGYAQKYCPECGARIFTKGERQES